jgi:inner membrane protein
MSMFEFAALYSPWTWFILAGILLIGELLSPGVFLIWLAGAAALTGLVDVMLGLSWQNEVVVFAVLSALLVLASWSWVKNHRSPKTDQPHLNLRHGAYVGRVYVLEKPIVNGSGKIKIEDSLWDVDGPDLPAGARVKVTGVHGLRLNAEPA